LWGAPGVVIRERPGYVNDPKKTCNEPVLSPCDYNFKRIRECMKLSVSITPPNYHLIYYNCLHWANQTVTDCVRFGKSGCGL
jgi:hypothetical protein